MGATRDGGDCRSSVDRLLSQLPSVLGRLVFLGSHYRNDLQRYEDMELAGRFHPDQIHGSFADAHGEMYDVWMGFSQSQKLKDLSLFLKLTKSTPAQAVNTIVNSGLQATPPAARERGEFKRELGLLLLLTSIDFSMRSN